MQKPKTKRLVKVDRNGLVRCRVCGCTEIEACNPPCGWADGDLCTTCAEAVRSLLEWEESARLPRLAPLVREFYRAVGELRVELTAAGRELAAGAPRTRPR